MVDVVSPQTMPSENEVHVARSFLTKILRSSMRKNRFRGKHDPGVRPHSWHASKLTDEESQPAGREATPAPQWQPKHEARPKESSTEGDQRTQQTNRSPLSSMERFERLSHPFPPGHLSPPKYMGSPEPLCGAAGKRDAGFSCFSSSSSPPVHDSSMSVRKGTSAENIFFKGLHGEGPQHRYLQPTLGNGGWEGSQVEEQPASRVSIAGRPGVGLVWQVPEKKRSQSPPPPPPPLRSDSFAATKVFPYSEGPSGPAKSQGRSQTCLRFQSSNQLHPNKLFSLSSSDISQSHYSQPPAHQRQYSDESPFYLQTRTAPPTKTQSVGSYYCSLQDLPTNAFSRKQVRHSTAFMAGGAANPSLESGGPSRYYGPAGKHPAQTAEHKARQSKSDGWRGETEKAHWMNSETSFSSVKAKYSGPQSQMPYGENKERHVGNGLHYENQSYEVSAQSHSPEAPLKGHSNDMKKFYPAHQNNDHKLSLLRPQDPWVPQEDHRISPLKTPLLHSLAQESRSLTERQPAASTMSATSTQEDTTTTGSGKLNRRSDRYATTLRKEIQQKRAQLQKSRSAATLTHEAEDDDADEWRSTETSASSNTYKDHLKEAQARVLQATSFQRRDLEPLGPEGSVLKAASGRIRGRRHFHPAKRTHSVSEPDKMDKVGVEGEPQTSSDPERKFSETKPAFSRPVLRSSPSPKLDETNKPKEMFPSRDPEETQQTTDPNQLSPGHKQVLLEQQRLGTFAEYQATWSKKKKSSDSKTQGRYHSAENILDASEEETAACVHERSRSSPSADFYSQNIPSQWRDPEDQQNSFSTREKAGSRSSDHSPQSGMSVPRNEGVVPGLPDHRTKPDPAGPTHATLSAGRRSASPNPDSQQPQTQSLLPPPRPHLGPETTSSSQEFLTGAQLDPAALQPLSSSGSDSQNHAAAGPAPPSSPSLNAESGPDPEEEKEQPEPPSASSSSSLTAGGARSPSPLFVPLRLTDRPPAVSLQDDSQRRSEEEPPVPAVMDVRSPVKKVPIRIVDSSDRQGQVGLHQSSETCSHVSALRTTEDPASPRIFTSPQEPDQEPDQELEQEPEQEPELSQESWSAGDLHLEDEAKREELARDIMGKDKSLVDILNQSGRRTTMDLMEGLFPPEEKILEGAQQRRRASAGSRLPTSNRREEEDLSSSAAASLVPSSSYYNTSAPKAELLIKMKDMQEQLEEQDSEDELDVDLASKKQELISSLARKLEVLREARQSLQEDVEDNEALGREVETTVQRLCQPNQLDKFRMFVGDLDKVVSLLLSLSGRLARVENALNSLEDDAPPEEKRTLTEKRKLLMRQHDDAKELKENLDRRERLVSSIMEEHLEAESLDDYRHFVKMKSALIIEQRKLEDKMKLGEEQLKCLMESLPLGSRT
ncbi:protein Shroom2 isoform X2 [Kryptolebias marmoratus]|uniref:Shroom family member 2 n=1 Tax=Kryptolebias marmoratus TaxID=37003 RepID=A0A3Q3EU49_KRYMA|nr:protein Shroom2 isoform X2 [Kryptolebias marmoratus]